MRAIGTVNDHLEGKTYLVGDSITLADLTLASAMALALAYTLDEEQRAKYSGVVKHFELIVEKPSLKDVFGEIKYTEKAIQHESSK